MANVKITELTALAAIDVADNDVLPVVDVGNDTTKKVAISDLRAAVAEANDFVTYTQLNANINVVQDNVEARHTQLDANINVVQDNVTVNFNQLDANINVVQDNVTVNFNQLDANINVVQDNVAATEARRVANVTIHNDEDTALQSRLSTNVTAFTNEDTALQSRLATNVTAFTNEDTALQARIAANTLTAASNDFVTFTRLNSNINVVQDNVAAAEANVGLVRSNLDSFASTSNSNAAALAAGIAGTSVNLTVAADSGSDDVVVVGTDTFTFAGGTGLTSTVSDNQIQFDLDSTAVTAGLYGGVIGAVSNVPAITIDAQGRVTSASNVQIAVDLSTLEGNVNTVSSNVDAVQSRLTTNVTAFTNEDTALQSRLATNVTTFTNEDTALQARIAANTLTAASNDFVTFTRLDSNINVVQDNVAAIIDGSTDFTGEVTMTDDLIVQGNLTINGTTVTVASTDMNITDRVLMLANGFTGSPSADVGLLFNRGNQGNAAFFYDESSVTFKISDTKDPHSNTLISPVTSANLDVGILTASTVKFDGADLSTAITDNVALLDTRANAFATFTKLDANIDTVSSNAAAVESRRVANIAGAISTVLTSDLTASRALVSDSSGKLAVSDITSTELAFLDGIDQNINSNLTALAAGISSVSGGGAFPTGDYGLLDSANQSTDAYGVAVAGLTTFDMRTDPSGSLATEDLGALT